MGLALTAQDVAALEGRTEGWIAALQLAALSMQGRDDVAGFIAGFAGDDRYIVDYLAEEVLQRQPEQVQHFLLQTSILDRLSGPLCDAVTGQDGGKAMLEALERGNLFLVPLDDRRRWYRYHHLFADVLQAHLLDEQPDDVPDLHRRASAWYEQNGEPSEAIRHALAAEDFERAADLVELAIPAMRQGRQEATLRRLARGAPRRAGPRQARAQHRVCRGAAGAAASSRASRPPAGRRAVAGHDADSRAGPEAPSAEMVVVDEEAFRRLPGSIAMYRAGQALVLGDVAGTVTHARRALDLVSEDDHLGRGAAAALLGLASWTSGDCCRAPLVCRGHGESGEGGHVADADDAERDQQLVYYRRLARPDPRQGYHRPCWNQRWTICRKRFKSYSCQYLARRLYFDPGLVLVLPGGSRSIALDQVCRRRSRPHTSTRRIRRSVCGDSER